jgi:alpha-D-xyloside xylohydrolase
MGVQVPSTATAQKLTEIRVYPGADGNFTLYDDDGVTNAYLKGAGRSAVLRWDDKTGKLTATGDKGLAGEATAAVSVVGR